MKFDLFHSIGRIDEINPRLSDSQVFENFLVQAELADALGFGTVWVAESHFSSEVQKTNTDPVIPNYNGEVGLNSDSCQLAHLIFSRTQRIGFGTAIYNIVGGNGGPIGAADRIRSLAFLNQLQASPRRLDIGIAQGRFPYINRPFGISPRDDVEKKYWSVYQRIIFLEALEIFLRLSHGETLASQQTRNYDLAHASFTPAGKPTLDVSQNDRIYKRRWEFEKLKLVPQIPSQAMPNFVLGSTDPLAHTLAMSICDVDIFNLSFTPPDKINTIHAEFNEVCQSPRRPWSRDRLPRTVLVFIDKDEKKAQELANQAFDIYISAMQGTVAFPPKEALMQRALIGNADSILEQLSPGSRYDFRSDDRLMLWFEFGESSNERICERMQYFSEKVMPHV